MQIVAVSWSRHLKYVDLMLREKKKRVYSFGCDADYELYIVLVLGKCLEEPFTSGDQSVMLSCGIYIDFSALICAVFDYFFVSLQRMTGL